MIARNKNSIIWVVIGVISILVGVGLWKTREITTGSRLVIISTPRGIMGTDCRLAVVIKPAQKVDAQKVLEEVESLLRSYESKMSIWLESSEITRFNRSEPNTQTSLSPETYEVLHRAYQAYKETGGVFDVTCGPLIELWKRAGVSNILPDEATLQKERAASGWEDIEIFDNRILKKKKDVRVDLGGIAKGYAIDRAIGVLQYAGFDGGLVDIGGDIRCFGKPANAQLWDIDIRNPFNGGILGKIDIPGGAVCTSGNYARFSIIDGIRYSHIIDPRTGKPADAVPSVTIYGNDALTADIWATALSVLGTAGLDIMPSGLEALMITGAADDYRLICTAGFKRTLDGDIQGRVNRWIGDE